VRWPRYVGERDPEAASGGLVDADFVVAAAQVLHKSMPGRDQSKPGHGLDPTHRPQPSCHLRVVGLDPVDGVSLAVVPRRRPQLIQDARVGGYPVGDDLHRHHTREPLGAALRMGECDLIFVL
jgi:hypothetical protein